jgi:hypothetical protein
MTIQAVHLPPGIVNYDFAVAKVRQCNFRPVESSIWSFPTGESNAFGIIANLIDTLKRTPAV